MGETQQKASGLRWNGEVGAGHVMQAATFVFAVIAGFVFFSAKADQTARDVVALRETLRENVTGLQAQMTQGFEQLRRDIAPIPDQRARLLAVERRLAEGDARDIAQDARIAAVERQAIETSAQLNNFRAASAQNLPGAPGVRTR